MLTVSDVMAHLCVAIGTPLSGTLEQQVRTAALNGWNRLFAIKSDWKWFHRLGTLQLNAAQTTGTVTFTESTRSLVLADATWPSNANEMHVRLGNAWYPVDKRVSSTELTFFPNQHPATDLAAETTYHIQKIIYPLPVEVGDLVQVINPGQTIALIQLSLAQTMEITNTFGIYGQPNAYALIADPKYPDRWSLWMPTILTTDTNLQYLYVQRRPANVIYRESRGQVTLATGTATFTDSICRSSWEGAVLRISRNTEYPTGPWGDMPVSDPILNQDMYEMKIVEYLTATTVRVTDLTNAVATAAPFVVSSHVDVKPGAMETLIQRLAEDQFGIRPVGTHMEGVTSQRRVREAILDAATEDSINFRQSNPLIPLWYRLRLDDIAGSVS